MEYTTRSGHVVLLDDDVALPGQISIGSHGWEAVKAALGAQSILLFEETVEIV